MPQHLDRHIVIQRLDPNSVPSLTLKDVFERALDAFGTKRVLFGTDSGPFPAGWREDRLSEQSSIVRSLGGSADEHGQIFGGNIARLLDLS